MVIPLHPSIFGFLSILNLIAPFVHLSLRFRLGVWTIDDIYFPFHCSLPHFLTSISLPLHFISRLICDPTVCFCFVAPLHHCHALLLLSPAPATPSPKFLQTPLTLAHISPGMQYSIFRLLLLEHEISQFPAFLTHCIL